MGSLKHTLTDPVRSYGERLPGDYEIQRINTLEVFTTSIDNSSWTAIPLPAGVDCNSFFGKCRSATNIWKMSHDSGGSPFITFEAGDALSIEIDQDAAATVYYIQGTEASDTFETLVGRRT